MYVYMEVVVNPHVHQHADDNQELSESPEDCKPTDHHSKAAKSPTEIFSHFIGGQELFSIEMWRAVLTELVATACLLFILTVSIISCLESNVAEPKLLVPVAIFIVAFFFLLTTIPLSGGHMSPVFTIIAALKGVTTFVRSVFYVLAQCAGSIIAYAIIKSVMNKNAEEKYSLGGCMIDRNGQGINPGLALILEFSCTFAVLFVGVTVGFDKRRSKELGLPMVCVILAGAMALASFVSISVTGRAGYAGVGLNPARCLGPAILKGGQLWQGHWVFWAGPFIACVVYYGFTLALPREVMERSEDELDVLELARAVVQDHAKHGNRSRRHRINRVARRSKILVSSPNLYQK